MCMSSWLTSCCAGLSTMSLTSAPVRDARSSPSDRCPQVRMTAVDLAADALAVLAARSDRTGA